MIKKITLKTKYKENFWYFPLMKKIKIKIPFFRNFIIGGVQRRFVLS